MRELGRDRGLLRAWHGEPTDAKPPFRRAVTALPGIATLAPKLCGEVSARAAAASVMGEGDMARTLLKERG
jgi:hypothetical protein